MNDDAYFAARITRQFHRLFGGDQRFRANYRSYLRINMHLCTYARRHDVDINNSSMWLFAGSKALLKFHDSPYWKRPPSVSSIIFQVPSRLSRKLFRIPTFAVTERAIIDVLRWNCLEPARRMEKFSGGREYFAPRCFSLSAWLLIVSHRCPRIPRAARIKVGDYSKALHLPWYLNFE